MLKKELAIINDGKEILKNLVLKYNIREEVTFIHIGNLLPRQKYIHEFIVDHEDTYLELNFLDINGLKHNQIIFGGYIYPIQFSVQLNIKRNKNNEIVFEQIDALDNYWFFPVF